MAVSESHPFDGDSIREVVQYPGEREWAEKDDILADAQEKVADADLVVLTDGDADGIASAALVSEVFDTMNIAMLPVGPHDNFLYPKEAMNLVLDYGREGMTVFFLDTCLGDNPDWQVRPLADLHEHARVLFFDHHEWTDDERVSYFRENTTHCEIDSRMETEWTVGGETTDGRCTVGMVYEYFTEQGVEFDGELADRVDAVTAGDLWMKNDSEEFFHEDTQFVLDSLEFITDVSQADRYTDAWYGFGEWADAFVNTDTALEDTKLATYASEYRTHINNRLDVIFGNDDFVQHYEVSGLDVAMVYGDVPPNDPANRLRQNGVDVVVVLFPWGKASFRSSDSFTDCHRIAEDLGGGGHENAAGGAYLDRLSDYSYSTEKEYYEDYGQAVHSALLDRIESHAQ